MLSYPSSQKEGIGEHDLSFYFKCPAHHRILLMAIGGYQEDLLSLDQPRAAGIKLDIENSSYFLYLFLF